MRTKPNQPAAPARTVIVPMSLQQAAEAKPQVVIRGGRLLAADGNEPDFSRWPDCELRLCNPRGVQVLLDSWLMLNSMGS
jgi:hypothetical protein